MEARMKDEPMTVVRAAAALLLITALLVVPRLILMSMPGIAGVILMTVVAAAIFTGLDGVRRPSILDDVRLVRNAVTVNVVTAGITSVAFHVLILHLNR